MRKTTKLGITLLVIAAVATSGIALAFGDTATDDMDPANHPAFGRIVEELGPLVDDGTITAAQAEAVAGLLTEARPGSGREPRGPGLEPIAEFLGIDAGDLRAALTEGSTLADLAADNGSSADALIDFLVTDAGEHLARAVADGKLDQADVADELDEITQRITEMVNGEFEWGPGHGGPGRPGGGHGPRGGIARGGPPADSIDA